MNGAVEPQAAFRELQGFRSVYGPDENGNYLENIQSMIKSKAELEHMHPPPAASWDPVLKRNRATRMKFVARLLEIGLLRPHPKGTAKYFLVIFFVKKTIRSRSV